jgi:hypothetical protein
MKWNSIFGKKDFFIEVKKKSKDRLTQKQVLCNTVI